MRDWSGRRDAFKLEFHKSLATCVEVHEVYIVWHFIVENLPTAFNKVGLEEIEKFSNPSNQYQILSFETWNWKVDENIWSSDYILVDKLLDIQVRKSKEIR